MSRWSNNCRVALVSFNKHICLQRKMSERKWAHKIVNTLYIHVAHMTPRFLPKVNTYISGSKHGQLILNQNINRKTYPRDHESMDFFPQKILQFLTKVPACAYCKMQYSN